MCVKGICRSKQEYYCCFAHLFCSYSGLPPIVCSEHTLNVVKRWLSALGYIDDTGLGFVTIALVGSVLALKVWLEVVVGVTHVCVAIRNQIDVNVLTQLLISRH